VSFATHILGWAAKTVGLKHAGGAIEHSLDPHLPPAPSVPNPNDAANQAQNLTDQMRMRRGLMANIYAGGATGAQSQPVVGKTALGT
jgi:hypothetical protein